VTGAFQKKKRWVSPAYLDWIRSAEQCCVLCGQGGWDGDPLVAHHAISVGLGGAMGSKADDSLAMPMHGKCHQEFHTHFPRFKEAQILWLIRTLNKSVQTFVERKQ